jgi:hypothetical protein
MARSHSTNSHISPNILTKHVCVCTQSRWLGIIPRPLQDAQTARATLAAMEGALVEARKQIEREAERSASSNGGIKNCRNA